MFKLTKKTSGKQYKDVLRLKIREGSQSIELPQIIQKQLHITYSFVSRMLTEYEQTGNCDDNNRRNDLEMLRLGNILKSYYESKYESNDYIKIMADEIKTYLTDVIIFAQQNIKDYDSKNLIFSPTNHNDCYANTTVNYIMTWFIIQGRNERRHHASFMTDLNDTTDKFIEAFKALDRITNEYINGILELDQKESKLTKDHYECMEYVTKGFIDKAAAVIKNYFNDCRVIKSTSLCFSIYLRELIKWTGMMCCNLFGFTYLTPNELCQYIAKTALNINAANRTRFNLRKLLAISIPAKNEYGFMRVRDICLKRIINWICQGDNNYFDIDNLNHYYQDREITFEALNQYMKIGLNGDKTIGVILNTSISYTWNGFINIDFQNGKVLYDAPGHSFVNLHIRIGDDTITANIDDGFNSERKTLDHPIDSDLIVQFADITSLIPIDILDLLKRNIIMRDYTKDDKEVARKRDMIYTAVNIYGWKSTDSKMVDSLNKFKGGHTTEELIELFIILLIIVVIIVVIIYVVNKFTIKRPCLDDFMYKNIAN